MSSPADKPLRHRLNTALTRISMPLQILELHTPLSEQQHQLVTTALGALADLNAILRDDVYRQLIEPSAMPNDN